VAVGTIADEVVGLTKVTTGTGVLVGKDVALGFARAVCVNPAWKVITAIVWACSTLKVGVAVGSASPPPQALITKANSRANIITIFVLIMLKSPFNRYEQGDILTEYARRSGLRLSYDCPTANSLFTFAS
jgi:hypothetical protein